MHIDDELLSLSVQPLNDVIVSLFEMVGFSVAIFSVIAFTVWGIVQAVGMFRQIINS